VLPVKEVSNEKENRHLEAKGGERGIRQQTKKGGRGEQHILLHVPTQMVKGEHLLPEGLDKDYKARHLEGRRSHRHSFFNLSRGKKIKNQTIKTCCRLSNWRKGGGNV